MSPKDQVVTLIGAINLLSELRDELYAKELVGSGDEIARVQSTLRRQMRTLVGEHHLEKVLMPPLKTAAELEQKRADQRMRDLGYYVGVEDAR